MSTADTNHVIGVVDTIGLHHYIDLRDYARNSHFRNEQFVIMIFAMSSIHCHVNFSKCTQSRNVSKLTHRSRSL